MKTDCGSYFVTTYVQSNTTWSEKEKDQKVDKRKEEKDKRN